MHENTRTYKKYIVNPILKNNNTRHMLKKKKGKTKIKKSQSLRKMKHTEKK